MMKTENMRMRTAAAIAALLLSAGDGAAAEGAKSAEITETANAAIKDLLAPKAGGAACFVGKFGGLMLNVWDYAKGKQVPVPGVFQAGQQAMRTEPAISLDQEVVELKIMLDHISLKDKSWDEMHMFYLEVKLKGWPKALRSSGECPWRATARPIEGFPDSNPATIMALGCGVEDDGGGFGLERGQGGGDVVLRFSPEGSGLRMTFASGGEIHLGGVRELGHRDDPNFRPTEFRLQPMAAEACRALGRAARKW